MAYINFKPSANVTSYYYLPDADTWNAWTGFGFQPDFTFQKAYDNASNWWGTCDSTRGVDASPGCEAVYVNDNSAEASSTTEYLDGYQSDGFTTGQNGSFGSNAEPYMAGAWKANGGTTVSNGVGDITSTVQANTTSGFSIVKYTGNATSGQTIGHGLGVTPQCIWVKNLAATENWQVYHVYDGPTKYYTLNTDNAVGTQTSRWNDTAPTSTTFTVGSDTSTNGSGQEHIAYVWAPIKGYSSFGAYTGNLQAADGPFINVGFRPEIVIVKRSDSTGGWPMYSRAQQTQQANPMKMWAALDKTNAGVDSISQALFFYASGFKLYSSNTDQNASGGNYIYMAWAREPLIGSEGNPGLAF
jgi:hypothetical protein